jgi:hypothetical protein
LLLNWRGAAPHRTSGAFRALAADSYVICGAGLNKSRDEVAGLQRADVLQQGASIFFAPPPPLHPCAVWNVVYVGDELRLWINSPGVQKKKGGHVN